VESQSPVNAHIQNFDRDTCPFRLVVQKTKEKLFLSITRVVDRADDNGQDVDVEYFISITVYIQIIANGAKARMDFFFFCLVYRNVNGDEFFYFLRKRQVLRHLRASYYLALVQYKIMSNISVASLS
jgi:2-phosphoglycerate kinase